MLKTQVNEHNVSVYNCTPYAFGKTREYHNKYIVVEYHLIITLRFYTIKKNQ